MSNKEDISHGIKEKTLVNMGWRFFERTGAQAVSFVVSIVLARLLLPEDYGLIALITVFTNLLQVFIDGGLSNSLIQKLNVDDLDYSTVFIFNMIICMILYLIMFILAPFIAAFYGNNELIIVTRVLSLTILISGFKSIQQAYVSKNLLFKNFFYSTLGGTIFSAFLGIYLAYQGYGYWAIVYQQLSNNFIDTIILGVTVDWRPKFNFSIKRFKTLFSFGWKILISSLLDAIYNNVRSLIIGKVYSPSDLAYYNRGQSLPYMFVLNINSAIDSVLLPVMASAQDNRESVKKMTRKAIKTTSFIIWPLMLGLFCCAEPLVSLLLTEKWLSSVYFLRFFCLTYALWPIHTSNLNAIKAMGRSDLFLKLEIIKKIIGFLTIVITIPFGVHIMVIGYFITGPISAVINAFPNRTLLNYTLKEQICDLAPYIGLAIVMSICIWPIQYIPIKNIFIVIFQMILGSLIYIIGARLCKFDVYYELINTVIKQMRRRGNEND